MKRTLSATIAALCVCASTNIFANPVSQAGVGSGTPAFAPIPEGSGVLYDQTSDPAGNGAPVQNFEPGLEIYDNQGADDFEVTDAAGWTIDRLNFVISQAATGTPDSVDVAIHANSPGGGTTDLPGAVICGYTALPSGQTGTPASAFNVVLPAPCILPQGRYWVSLVANQSFAASGQVFWSNRLVQDFSGAAWVNPGDGFGTGCTTFTPMTVCGVGGNTVAPPKPDFLFQIVGVVGGLDADIAIVKTADSPAAPVVGDTVTFTLTVSNAGPADAENVVVTDTLPANVTYVSDTCGAAVAGSTVTWTVGTLADGANAICDIVTTINNFGEISNTATVASTTNDPDPANNSSTVVIVGVPPPADLAIVKTATAPPAPVVGDTVTFTLAVNNGGPADAENVVVTDVLPANVTYVSNTCMAAVAGNTVTWTIGTLANGANATCDIVTTINNFGEISNTATVASTTTDPDPANNSSTVVLGGVPFPADVAITISAAPAGGLAVGDTFVYTVTGTNNGPGDAAGVLFSLILSNKVSFVSSTCGAVLTGNTVSWSVPTLANGASTSCQITVAVVLGGDIAATASVSTTTVDPVADNNSASVVVGFDPVPVPTLDRLSLLLAGLLVMGLGLVTVRRF